MLVEGCIAALSAEMPGVMRIGMMPYERSPIGKGVDMLLRLSKMWIGMSLISEV